MTMSKSVNAGRWLLLAVAWLAVALAACFTAWDLAVFQPRKARIDALLAQVMLAERSAPPALASAVLDALNGKPSVYASRLLMTALAVPTPGSGNLAWHVGAWLWDASVRLHLSEQQQLAVILSQSPMGQGIVGYTAAAQLCFHKPLAQLSMEESRFLAALGKAPSRHVTLCRLQGR